VPPSHRVCQPLLQRDRVSCFACPLFDVSKKQLRSITHFVEQAPCGLGGEHHRKSTEHVCHVVEGLVEGYEGVEDGKGGKKSYVLAQASQCRGSEQRIEKLLI
jgi:hypothetical protein